MRLIYSHLIWFEQEQRKKSVKSAVKQINPTAKFFQILPSEKNNYSLKIIQNFNERRKNAIQFFIHVKSRFVSRVCRVAQRNKANSFGECNWTHCCALLLSNNEPETLGIDFQVRGGVAESFAYQFIIYHENICLNTN